MSAYKLALTSVLTKQIKVLHPLIKRKIRSAFEFIVQNPEAGKALVDELKGCYSYRLGKYRIVYSLDHSQSEIRIVALGARKTIYQETLRLINKDAELKQQDK